jgi:GNAT superfamily N-acetyltransferase
MTVRRFRDEDIRRVSYLIRKTLRVSNSKDYSTEEIDRLVQEFTPGQIKKLSKKREIYVVEGNENLLATGGLEGNWILTFFVNPREQKRGIGSRLLAHLERRAKENGYDEVIVPASFTGLPFYQGRGYRKAHDQSEMPDGCVKMFKRLENTEPSGAGNDASRRA